MIITVEDLKRHLNIQHVEDDQLLADKIIAATSCVENFIGGNIYIPYPEPIKEAIRQLAAHFYDNREPVVIGQQVYSLPYGVFDLVGPYRAWRFS
ncbi:MAG: head-tail connector protein [Allorhizobium sp.]